jgi:soluble lytic murein transglycosylase
LSAVLGKRKRNKRNARRRAFIIFILITLALILNADSLQRFYYPFPYQSLIFKYAAVYEQDPYLLAAIIKAESNFDSRAVSAKGARGLMQIMPETGEWVAGQLGYASFKKDQLFEPETNIKFGAWYLDDLDKEYDGSTILMLAAYNGGRGNVSDWIEGKDLSGSVSTIDQIPFPETKDYVKKVLSYHKKYIDLYGQKNR